MFQYLAAVLPSAISIAVVFLLGCIGETITEKAGNLNLGIPGIMCFGVVGGCTGTIIFMDHMNAGLASVPALQYLLIILMGLSFALVFGALGGLIYAFLTTTLKANQNVTGLALTTFGAGFANFFMSILRDEATDHRTKFRQASDIIHNHIPNSDANAFTKIFFGHSAYLYIAFAIAVLAFFFLRKTRKGLSLRAVGENPATADAAGINVTAYKYAAILVGSGIAGFGGFFYVIDFVFGSWEMASTIQSFGWLALALVIFTVWNPLLAIFGSILFGFLYVGPIYINGVGAEVVRFLNMLPYLVTILVLIMTSIFGKKSVLPPGSLGVNYFREER